MLAVVRPIPLVIVTLPEEKRALAMPLAPLPLTYVELPIVEKALALSLSLVVFPLSIILIVVPDVFVRAHISPLAVSHLVLVD
jgi:hypothetical protein